MLAIGIVVDDAIVVVENIERWMAKGLPPREATLHAMAEITGPVIAITMVLSSVFIPTAFIPGISGQFYRQFALTIAASTIISALNALTMSPSRAIQLIRPHTAEHAGTREALPRFGIALLGAFLANLTTAGSVVTSIGIGMGNTLEGLVGALLVNRFAGGRNFAERALDIFKFVVLAGIVSTMVSATFGVTSLSLGGFARWANYGPIWLTWWLGDAAGDLLVAPLLVLWSTGPYPRWRNMQILEPVVLLLGLWFVGKIVFVGWLATQNNPLEFLAIPFLVWVAFRFRQCEAATVIFMFAGISLWGTLHGFGPFARREPNESLLLLQAFMGVMAVMTLAISAVVSEQKRSEEALRASERSLASALEIAEAAVISVDGTQRIILFDASAERIEVLPIVKTKSRLV